MYFWNLNLKKKQKEMGVIVKSNSGVNVLKNYKDSSDQGQLYNRMEKNREKCTEQG